MIKEGKYLATIKNYGVGESSTGKAKIDIQFGFKDQDGVEQTLWWNGYMTEKSIQITAKALVNCGLKGSDYDKLAYGVESGMLNIEKPVEIEVVHDTFEGKTREKIAWVNRPGGAQFMEPGMASQKLKGLNLAAAVAAARTDTGIKEDSDSLPF